MPILKRNGKTFSGTPTKVDTAKSYTTFDSADDKNPTTWSDVELLTSKEEQRSLFSKISTMFKNIRYLYKMLGTTDISQYSDGTVTGAVKAACDKADANEAATTNVNNKLGSTDISAIDDGTVTGGLSVLSNNACDLKMLGWTVPKECPVQNYVDENGVFHQIVGRVDLSKLMWEWADTLNEFRTDLYIMGMNPHSTNIYCSKYQFGSEMYISGMGIYIKDPNYDSSTISQFKADNKGVYFYYELATEITKPIDGNEAIKLLNDKLGNTNISGIGDGTVTGGLNALNSKLGNTDISAIGDGTVTGGLNALNSNLYNAKNPVMLYDISTNSYNANDFLGGNIDMSAYSGFLIYYSDRTGGYQKSSYFTGKMSGMYQALDFTNGNDKHYFAGVQVRGNGLFVEIVGANKPFIWRLYGIPA